MRDHFMIAHSLRGEMFGPARRLHGATYVVDVTFRRSRLDDHGVVVDIGLASDQVASALADLRFRNLDEAPEFAEQNTTTEFLAHEIFDRLARAINDGDLGEGAHGIETMCVTLKESHLAWASYEGQV